LFADDTLIHISGTNINDIADRFNSDINVVSDWFKVNNLKLNVDKTKFQFFSRSPASQMVNVRAMIDHQQLEQVGVVKCLGIQIDENFNFAENFNFILKKKANKINFLGRIRRKLTLNSRKLVYQTIISPHIDYCSSILSKIKKIAIDNGR
jgi:hypothetical protein